MRENAIQFSKVSHDHLTCLPPMLSRDSWILWTDSVPVVTAMSPLRVLQKCWVSSKFLLVAKARYLSCSCLQTTVLSSCNSSMCWDLTCPVSQLNTFPPPSSSAEHWDQAFRQTLEIILLRYLRWRQLPGEWPGPGICPRYEHQSLSPSHSAQLYNTGWIKII